MIEIKGFIKKFGERYIYKNLSISLPNKGVIGIVGESGSGKTTLLNAIAGLDFAYEGSISINGTNLKNLNQNELCDYRIHNIGYVFQNFKLINLETAETNILLPFDTVSNASKTIKKRKVNELADLLGIKKLLKQNVNKLSGGEKQRVAIARAMINAPTVILCDEPTGALDEINSKQIYEILKKISTNSLVVIASHDLEGIKAIADKLIKIKDGEVEINDLNENIKNESMVLLSNNKKIQKSALNFWFKIKHSIQKIKAKKYRSLITNGMLSLSLTGVGLSLIISSSVSNKIEEAFSSLINGNQIVMSLKQDNQNAFSNVYSAPYKKVESIYEKYKYYIDGIGSTFLVNFEDFFKDRNRVYFWCEGHKIDVPSLSTRSVNDFKWLGYDQDVIYPYSISSLKDDEVVVGLSYQDMLNICFNLHIQRNFSSLGEYIKTKGLYITLEIENNDWYYDDEQIFEIKGILETNKSIFYHSNTLWNETVFEKMMMMPSDDDEIHYFPWEMFKLYYFKTNEDPNKFLDVIFYDDEFKDFVFERTNYDYHPLLCLPNQICNEKRVLIYYVDKNCISPAHLQYISQLEPKISDYYFISDFGYSSYASNLLSGFSKNLFVSLDEDKIDLAIDADTQLGNDSNVELDLPDEVVQGNFLNGISGGLRFSSKMDKLIYGRKPLHNKEIVISKGLGSRLDKETLGIGKYLYIAGENREYLSEDKVLLKEYMTSKVVIVGIVDEEQNYLYHDPLWTISFFRDNLGVSNFYLIPKSVVIELDKDVDASKIIDRFNKMFHEYNFSSPVNELSNSVNTTLNYANAILLGFSILSSFISVLLLGTIVLLNILESKEEINLLHVIGIKQKDINSTFVVQSIIHGLIAFVISAVELVLVDFVISKALGDSLHTTLTYKVNIMPIIVVFVFAIALPYLTSLTIVKVLSRKKK